jgi:Flp pilus assembly protein TadB
MMELLGWAATALFALSYACRKPDSLRIVQAGAAVLWIVYGIGLAAAPVVVANVVVASLALVSVWRLRATTPRRAERAEHPAS